MTEDLTKYKQPFDPDWPHGHLYNGCPARIVATDAKGGRPIVSLIYDEQTGLERCAFFHDYTSLINAPAPKRTWWINFYLNEFCSYEFAAFRFDSQEEANRYAKSGRIACIKITEGEGLEDD